MSYIKGKYSLWRKKQRQNMLRKKQQSILGILGNKKIIILNNDCTGGMLMHDYCLPQASPMVNVWYSADDFLKICENPDKYFSGEFDEIWMDGGVPTARINDVVLHFGHNHDLISPKKNWKKGCRHFKKAIESNNYEICVIMNDRNGFKGENMIKRFDALPYKYKVIFTHIKYDSPYSFYMENEDDREYVDVMTNYENRFTVKRRYDRFDFYSWFVEMLTEVST